MHRHLRRSIRTSQTVFWHAAPRTQRDSGKPRMITRLSLIHRTESGQSTILEYGVYSVVRRQYSVEMRLHL